MGIVNLDHVGIRVNDMEQSVRFYTTVLQLEERRRLELRPGYWLVFLGVPGTVETLVELIGGDNDDLPEAGKVNHVCFTVDRLNDEIERLRQLDVQFQADEPKLLPNGARNIFLYGPSREYVELIEYPSA